MKKNDLIEQRLVNQGLREEKFDSPGDTVRWMCAMQAQDYLGALWSIGQRCKDITESKIEKAIADRKIVRTWPMRGTLHFVAPEDVRWMLKLLTPRVIARSKKLYQDQGLDAKTLLKSKKVIEHALTKNVSMTRQALYAALEKDKIAMGAQHGIHIIGHAAQEQLICLGPRTGKQHTFVLLDAWIPESKSLTLDESLAELASRYLDSHGPATMQDFSWWSGLTLTEVKRSFEMNKEQLISFTLGDLSYFMKSANGLSALKSPQVALLSWFDEYIIGYKDRSAAFDLRTEKFIEKPKNGIYTPVILIDGKIAGNWKRSLEKQDLKIEIVPFRKFTTTEKKNIAGAIEHYRSFLGLD